MKRTQQILLAELAASVVLSLLFIVVYESDVLTAGSMTGDANRLFLVTVVMELVTICFISLALYLFKIELVHRSLTVADEQVSHSPAQVADLRASRLLRWGTVRLLMLCLPMVLNTLFYYLFGYQVAFGYMAIILFLCLFMVYPSMGRCLSDTESADSIDQNEQADSLQTNS